MARHSPKTNLKKKELKWLPHRDKELAQRAEVHAFYIGVFYYTHSTVWSPEHQVTEHNLATPGGTPYPLNKEQAVSKNYFLFFF